VELNYGDSVTIILTRVKDETGPTHWEVELIDSNYDGEMFGTSPSFGGALDMALDIVYEKDDGNWTSFDANRRNND